MASYDREIRYTDCYEIIGTVDCQADALKFNASLKFLSFKLAGGVRTLLHLTK